MNIDFLEKKFKIKRLLQKLLIILMVVLPILIITLFFVYQKNTNFLYCIYGIIAFMIIIAIFYVIYDKYFLNIFSKYCVDTYLVHEFENFKLNNHRKYDNNDVLEILSLNKIGHFSSNYKRIVKQRNHIIGTFNNINFQQNDLFVENSKEEYHFDEFMGKRLFDGILTEIDFSLGDFSMLITPKEYDNVQKPFTLITTSDVDFNNKFDLMCDEPEKINEYFTKKHLELFNTLISKYLNKDFFILIYDNKIYIGQDKKKSFEINIKKELNDKEIIDNLSKNILYIKDIIKYLKENF